ncbi:MAG: AMP-binding protein [Muribaculaceae bacterium]|nr:AMP-binding protein [Muribaculaceae bacterium]
MKHQTTLNAYIQQSIRENWDSSAMTDFHGNTLIYRDVARKIAKLHILFKHAGLVQGDKIAFCGRNCSQWAVAALASLTYGTVAVPILHDFKPDTIHHLVSHCEAKLLFTDKATWEPLNHDDMPHLKGAVNIADYSLLFSRNKELTHAREKLNHLFGEKYPERFAPEDVVYPDFDAQQLAVINYTSGSTGFSKGVMLSYGALWSNIQYSIDGLAFLKPGDGMVSMLPLAHMFGFSIELLHPLVKGCHIYFLTRTPSPKIILEAFSVVKPKLIVAVPLILEKIVKTRIFPELEKPMMKILLHTPGISKKVLAKIKDKMLESFGGNLKEIIIGGAGLNKEVETFLRKIKFPYTVGYGMTECGPLISYSSWQDARPGSCGRIVDRMQVRIDSPDPAKTPGIIWVKGDNVMQGYFKNPEATEACFDADGWMNTGDIGQMDAKGFLYLRGRDKNMILGPSGQNIYPEEIEQILNNLPYVAESIIVSQDGKLKALIHPDLDTAAHQGISEKQIDQTMADNIKRLNAELPSFSQVSSYQIFKEEFEKTPKRSIKRYLYQ